MLFENVRNIIDAVCLYPSTNSLNTSTTSHLTSISKAHSFCLHSKSDGSDLINSVRNKSNLTTSLILNGADPNLCDETGQTALHITLANQSWDLSEMLIASGTDLAQCSDYNPNISLKTRIKETKCSELISLISETRQQATDKSHDIENLQSILAHTQARNFIAKDWFFNVQNSSIQSLNFWIGQLGFLIRKKEYLMAFFLIKKFPQLILNTEIQPENLNLIKESFENLKLAFFYFNDMKAPKFIQDKILEYIYPIPLQYLRHIANLTSL